MFSSVSNERFHDTYVLALIELFVSFVFTVRSVFLSQVAPEQQAEWNSMRCLGTFVIFGGSVSSDFHFFLSKKGRRGGGVTVILELEIPFHFSFECMMNSYKMLYVYQSGRNGHKYISPWSYGWTTVAKIPWRRFFFLGNRYFTANAVYSENLRKAVIGFSVYLIRDALLEAVIMKKIAVLDSLF